MDSDYFLAKQPHTKKGRYYKYEHYLHKNESLNSVLEKRIVNGDELENLHISDCADDMTPGVVYSVNKKGRWKNANATSFLTDIPEERDVDVAFIEQSFATCRHPDLASSVSVRKNGTISIAVSAATASRDFNLLTTASGRTKDELNKPRIEYVLHTVHPSTTKFRRIFIYKGLSRYNQEYNRGGPQRGATNYTVTEYDQQEGDGDDVESVESGEGADRREREFRLTLEDCLQTRRQSAEKRQRRRVNTDEEFVFVEPIECMDTDCTSTPSETEYAFC